VRILGLLGYRVLAAHDGESAERICREHEESIDLLLSDVVMPGMNGKELSVKLTSLLPRMRVLFMSGYSENVIAHRGVIDPGVPFVQKPFSVSSLARKIREVLDAPE
jgi:two-component system cell cycle sensor histidine kinase/response regulator CckA